MHADDVADPDPAREATDVIGAAEVMLDHTAAGAALAEAVRTLALVVALGLLALWLVLFRTVWTASRRLQATALENARLALLDSLTGLPNRRMLAERMRRTILEAEETGSRVGLMLLDIDRFKDINDSLGHDRGDELLEQVAERLRGALRDDDVVARLGGDEFAILLPDVRSVANAERLARRVRGLFVPPFMLGELPLHVDTSVGVACLPDHATDPSSLMRTADVAMYAAKHHRTGVSVYSADEDDSSPARLVLLGDLHRALTPAPGAPRELRMHYQPKIELATGRTVGLEALMRWVHPTRGVLPPTTFIPLAEQSGLIHDVTRYALTECVTQLAAWRAEGRATPVAVNLSAHDVTTVAVVDLIESLLEEHTVPADLLEVEITETALVADPSRVVPVLERLGALGIRVAIDDFGIGNTSISQLRDLPVDELKIDRLFVADLGVDGREGSEVVVQAMVDLAHSFDLRVVAEGVEDEPTAVILRRLGVDQAQGFLYSQAVPGGRPAAHAVGARGRAGTGLASRRCRGRRDRVPPRRATRVLPGHLAPMTRTGEYRAFGSSRARGMPITLFSPTGGSHMMDDLLQEMIDPAPVHHDAPRRRRLWSTVAIVGLAAVGATTLTTSAIFTDNDATSATIESGTVDLAHRRGRAVRLRAAEPRPRRLDVRPAAGPEQRLARAAVLDLVLCHAGGQPRCRTPTSIPRPARR